LRTIIVDSRQQTQNKSHKAKEVYFKKHGFNVLRSKLPIADYSLLDNMSVVVDSKDGLAEVCQNLCSSKEEHERFRRECQLAQENGIKLYILVEEDQTDELGQYVVNKLSDVCYWQNPRLKIRKKVGGKWIQAYPKATTGVTLMKAMITTMYRYKCEWCFCRKKDAGKKILELLGVEENE